MKANLKILIAIALTIMVFSCKPKEQTSENIVETENNEEVYTDTNIYSVKTIKIKNQKINKTEPFSATLLAWETAHIGPAMGGQIEKIFVEPGDRVKKGNLLVKMDQSQLIQAKIQFEDAKKDFERMDTLIAYGSISKQTYDKAKMGYELAKTALQTLDENVNLYAPFNGIITGKYYNEKEMYSSMSPNMETGVASVVSIMQIDVLKTIINVSEKYWPIIRKNMSVDISCEIYPGETFEGIISNVYPTINAATKTFKVEVKILNINEKLRPGMYAKAELNFGEKETLVIPVIAVLKQDGTNNRFVFVVNDNKAEKRFVNIGKRFDDKIEITYGISTGESLVVAGQAKLMDGSSVKIIK